MRGVKRMHEIGRKGRMLLALVYGLLVPGTHHIQLLQHCVYYINVRCALIRLHTG